MEDLEDIPLDDVGDQFGWLCPTPADRARLVDLNPAANRARRRCGLCLWIGSVAVIPWLGWLPTALVVGAFALLLPIDRMTDRSRRPERVIVTFHLLLLSVITTAAAVTGGAHSPALPLVALPVMGAAARFRARVLLVLGTSAVSVMATTILVLSPHAFRHDPSGVIITVTLIACLIALQLPVLDAESRWRDDAVLDPLTGLLNRHGLSRRFAELAEQARQLHMPVSVVLFDLDAFKAVNDTHGHAAGDEVLTTVAATLRSQLRSFELLYRLGGDELLLVLPGTTHPDAIHVAEQARLAVRERRPAGIPITMSSGVSTAYGDDVVLAEMSAVADRALYEAKRRRHDAAELEPAVPVALAG